MDKELEELKAQRDAARRAVEALTDQRVEEEALTLRARLVALEHEERKSFGSLNGDGAEGLRVSAEKQAVQGRLRALAAVRDARSAQRQEAGLAVRRAEAALSRGVTREFAGAQAGLETRLVKLLGDVAAILAEGYDSADALRSKWGVGPNMEALDAIRQAVAPLRAVLQMPVWLTRREEAEREALARSHTDRKQAENAARYVAEEKRLKYVKGLSPDKRNKILAQERERMGVS